MKTHRMVLTVLRFSIPPGCICGGVFLQRTCIVAALAVLMMGSIAVRSADAKPEDYRNGPASKEVDEMGRVRVTCEVASNLAVVFDRFVETFTGYIIPNTLFPSFASVDP